MTDNTDRLASVSSASAEGGYKAHFERMQDMMRRYIEPITYVASFPADSTKHATEFEEPGPHDSSTNSEGKRRRMDRAFISDMIHMMDGPEQRALSASPEPVPATNQAGEVDWAAVGHEYAEKALSGGWPQVQSPQYALSGGFTAMAREIERLRATLATQPATSQEGEARENNLPACTKCGAPAGLDCRTGQGRIQPCYGRELATTPTPPTLSEDLRALGQAEGFAAAVQWLRDRSAMKPPASLWAAAETLADQMEQSRIPALAQVKAS